MNIALLLAAGQSVRFGSDKLFASLKGKPVIAHSLRFFENSSNTDAVFVAASSQNKKNIEELVAQEGFKKVKKVIVGGATRYQSVFRLLPHVVNSGAQYFVIHNAANPMLEEGDLARCFDAFKGAVKGVAVGRKIQSTVKNAPGGIVKNTVSRAGLWEAETPQVVCAKDFLEACDKFPDEDFTDDISVLEADEKQTAMVEASYKNRKITVPEDLELLRFFAGEYTEVQSQTGVNEEFFTGIGEDSHAFAPAALRRASDVQCRAESCHAELVKACPLAPCLVLGGVKVPDLPALAADSDGDVIIHALCNAISSAIGQGSLGTYATDMCKKGIKDSKEYLKIVLGEMARKHRRLIQCSISIEAAKPNIDALTPEIKKNLSGLLDIPEENIGITATSGEGLTPFGRGEAIKCQAVVVIKTLDDTVDIL